VTLTSQRHPQKFQGTYRKAQEEAKVERLGLWSDPNAHHKQIGPNTPSPQLASPSPSESLMNSDEVWVNPKSG
jgi:hypothetical protein